ncbi:hypothetical protein CEP52_003002 [Fusarium oligoseptatum]|uniref:Uncharacterized protein n=1 Tax=Fusarium oligoseptatum TaxID=2604345 RepID=A0A428UB83_9HYPO|nr:hypothetical protein CEP52_003002 [Fusarium oligoseptatum]
MDIYSPCPSCDASSAFFILNFRLLLQLWTPICLLRLPPCTFDPVRPVFANQGTLAPAGDPISLSIQWRPGRLEPCGAPLSLPPARAAAGRVLGAGEEDLGWRIGCSNEALRSSLFFC